ncbi:polysaccharide biosynthesis/export family protein [Prosthecobacter dejongeii]|uniref:Polysaccharide export outer membrane protein n=1 Tax=Prosthecobacter dejongeii TaxID=48465 RepID=A0A7W8DN24_9BACT|nr:polysaccharide biosynthesis/export family protein [Prosthecobacter dejongeii]MBB5036094.1 polysaccharide export outer membrane protein [Prosthecobacter dejongeii]
MTRYFLFLLVFLELRHLGYAQSGELPLRPGDRITISVGAIPDNEVAQIKGVYTVSDSGTINLLHIGEVRALGLKPSALQRSIEQTYVSREIYTRPNVLVSIDSVGDATMRQVMVTGVNKPGAVPYKQNMTLSQAIMTAGGPTPFGSMRKVKLVRAGRAPTVHNLSSGTGNPSVDVQVQPDDQIIVPE